MLSYAVLCCFMMMRIGCHGTGTSSMDDVIAFLRARIHEAQQISGMCDPGMWFSARTVGHRFPAGRSGVRGYAYAEAQDWDQPRVASVTDARCERHIVHNAPSRVLSDLAAKSKRLDYLENVQRGSWIDAGEHEQAEHLLRLEAAAYNWHPDYRHEWLP